MKKTISLFVSFMLLLLVCGIGYKALANVQQGTSTEVTSKTIDTKSDAEQSVNGQLKVHYINVGQADSILLQQGGQNMLIDAGNNDDADTVVNYLKEQGVRKLDYFVMTHPHEDHIGGANAVINTFDVGTTYMPNVMSTTQTFKDVITAMNTRGLKATAPVPGSTFKLGDAVCTILAPNGSNYEDLNNYSIVLKLVFGSNKFIFEGDAEDISENEILKKGYDISADVIKIGHHGSNSSTTQAYISKVSPKYAVISVGKGNDYGHPVDATLSRINGIGAKIYRTDEAGTIVAVSDGKSVTFNNSPSTNIGSTNRSSLPYAQTPSSNAAVTAPPAQMQPITGDSNRIVYYTEGGKSYHYSKSCSTLSRSKNILEGKLQDVIKLGKSDPCDKCVK